MPHRPSTPLLAALLLVLAACGGTSLEGAEAELEQQEQALNPACSSGEIAWSHDDTTVNACDGVWKYKQWATCTMRHASCGTDPDYCPSGWNVCENWAFANPPHDLTPPVVVSGLITRTFTVGMVCREPEECIPGSYCKPTCSVDTATANSTCDSKINTEITNYRNTIPTEFDPQVQLEPGSRSLTYVAASSTSYTAYCKFKIRYPTPPQAADKLCGCSGPLGYKSCAVQDPACGAESTWRYSTTLGQTVEQLKASDPKAATESSIPLSSRPVCTTCEHLDLPLSGTDPAKIQAKYQCLQTHATVPNAATQDLIVRNRKLLYELWGNDLTEAQRTNARSLYESHPSIGLHCGATVTQLPMPATCPAAALGNTQGTLLRCQRLLDTHVPANLASRELLQCTGLLNKFIDLPSVYGASTDTACQGTERRELLRPVTTQLLQKQSSMLTLDPLLLGAPARQLYLIDRWYDASKRMLGTPEDPEPAQLTSELSGAMKALWTGLDEKANVYAALETTLPTDSFATVEPILRNAAQSGRQVEQNLVKAAFTPVNTLVPDGVSVNGLPIRGTPLLTILGDSFQSVSGRLDDLTTFHDFACQFRSCGPTATPTPAASLWRMLAHVEDATALGSALSSTSNPLSGWRDAFVAVQGQHATLRAALDPVAPGGSLADVDPETLPVSVRTLARVIGRSQNRYDSYAATGLFDPRAGDTLYAGVDQQSRAQVIGFVQTRSTELNASVNQYRDDLSTLVHGLLGEIDAGASAARLDGLIQTRSLQFDQLASDLNGLHASAQAEEARYADVFAAYAAIEESLDSNQYFQVGDSHLFTVSGADAAYVPPSVSLSALSAYTISNVPAGRLLAVQAQGRWSPTCALRSLQVFNPSGGYGPVDAADAETGPEGFYLSWSNGQYHAESSSSVFSHGWGSTVGVRGELCVDSGLLGEVTGFKPSVCAYADANYHAGGDWSDSESSGFENRTSASFSGGLRLKDTPFPDAPAGSLLAVITRAGTADIVDVQVVFSPNTTILLPTTTDPSLQYDVRFIVNDLGTCEALDGDPSLTVNVTTHTTVEANAAALVGAMSEVLADLRAQRALLVGQGRILPTQLAALRSDALLALQTRISPLPLSGFPSPLMDLFQAYVDKELVRLERAVEMQSLERDMTGILIELDVLKREQPGAAAQSRLRRLIVTQTLRNLDGEQLRRETQDLLHVTRDYLHPILNLWYPSTLTAVAPSTELDALLNAPLDARFDELAGRAQTVIDLALDQYAIANFGNKPPGEELPVIALSFARPSATPTSTDDFGPLESLSSWRKADMARSQLVWDAINNRTSVSVPIFPEDVYSMGGAVGTISCFEALPVIKAAALYGIRDSAPNNEDLTIMENWLHGYAEESQTFAAQAGPSVYHLNNGVWQNFKLPLMYGTRSYAINTFRTRPKPVNPIGLSPFGTFTIDFSQLIHSLPENGFDDDSPYDATEIVLLMEVDTKAVGSKLSWVGGCF